MKARIMKILAIIVGVVATLMTLVLLCRIPGWRRVGLKENPESGVLSHWEARAYNGKGEFTDRYQTQEYYIYACGAPARPATETDEPIPAQAGYGPWFPVLSHFSLWLYGGTWKWCLREACTAAYWTAWVICLWLVVIVLVGARKFVEWLPTRERALRVNDKGTLGERIVRWWRNGRHLRLPFSGPKEAEAPRD